ncbi:MAG TPA: ATP phosphoribosyltransferase, partial [Chloroflexota bacterium]|nr:ATP phosphoribosyltransferase [Chloroflexota bacterium]
MTATRAKANGARTRIALPHRAEPSATVGEGLRFGVPTGKRFEERALQFLDSCGLSVKRAHERQLTADFSGLPGVTVIVQRARDILTQVTDGKLDAGITGMDLVEEFGHEGGDLVILYKDLGFSAVNVELVVPDSWVDVVSLADLADVAATMRERGDELRIATTFPRLTQRFLYQKGITHFTIVPAEGGVEAAPSVGFADVVSDVIESGVSLKENRLKLLRNGRILHSEACIVGNRRALAGSRTKRELTRRILELIEARLRAQDYYSVTANLRGESEAEVARALLASPVTHGRRGPTVARVYTEDGDERWFAATIIVDTGSLQPAIDHLRAVGGSGISVVPVRYLFDERSHVYEAVLAELGVRHTYAP